MTCPNCGFQNDPGVSFCGSCGERMPEQKVKAVGGGSICPHCGAENPPGSRFCQICGKGMVVSAPQQAPLPAQALLQPNRSMPGWAWAGIGILVVALAAGAILFFNRSDSAPTDEPSEVAPQKSCGDKLVFVEDVTVPDGTILGPGEVFTKTWRIRNAGGCTWTAGYKLTFKEGQQMGASRTLDLASSVSPGGELDLSLGFTAPSDPGTYKGFWSLMDEDGSAVPVEGVAGNAIFVEIRVRDASMPVMEPYVEGDEAEKISDLVENESSSNNTWTVNIPADKPLRFTWGWCAMTRAILDQNLQNMQIQFILDGGDVTESLSQEYGTAEDWSCLTYRGVIRSWPPGQHTVLYKMVFKEKINDGERDYEGENTKTYIINVTP